MAPVELAPQRALPDRQITGSLPEKRQPASEFSQENARRERPEVHGGKLQCQGQAVQAHADLGHRRGALFVQGEPGQGRGSPVDEEAHRLGAPRHRRRLPPNGKTHGRYHDHLLCPQSKRFPAGGEHLQSRAACQELGHSRRRRQQVFEVVEEQQHVPLSQGVSERIRQGSIPDPRFPNAHRGCDGGRHLLRLAHRREVHEEHAVFKTVREPGGGLQREPRLARTRGAGQRHDPRLLAEEGLPHGDQIILPADERRRLRLQVVRPAVERLERRDIAREGGVLQPEDGLCRAKVSQPMSPKAAESRARGKHCAACEPRRRVTEQDLPGRRAFQEHIGPLQERRGRSLTLQRTLLREKNGAYLPT